MASKGNADAVLQTLKEGGVDVDAKGGWVAFARELVGRASGKSSGATKPSAATGASSGKRVTESEMRKKAAGYSLLDMQDDAPVGKSSYRDA